jgi:uncharacterized protein
MAKIDDLNHVLYPDAFIRKSETKKTGQPKKKSFLESESKSDFQEILFNETLEVEKNDLHSVEIEKLLKDIGIQGEILKKSKDLEDLEKYKKMVHKFVLGIVDVSENTEKKVIWNKFKKEKIAKIHLQVIDKELLELARIFISEQYNVLEVASKIDKIQGMLVDMAS